MSDKREFLHSISRITDRLIQAEKDVERIERNCKDLRADIEKTREALESFFNDALKGEGDGEQGKI